VVNAFAVTMLKMSILAFINRLSSRTSVTVRWLVRWTAAFVILCNIGVVLSVTFQCKPISAGWSLAARIPGPYKCIPIHKVLTIWSTLYAITDFVLVLLPSTIVWQLKLALHTRIGIIFIFCLGFAATAAAMVKAITVWTAFNTWDPTCESRAFIVSIDC
jgi:hypothetical protein